MQFIFIIKLATNDVKIVFTSLIFETKNDMKYVLSHKSCFLMEKSCLKYFLFYFFYQSIVESNLSNIKIFSQNIYHIEIRNGEDFLQFTTILL